MSASYFGPIAQDVLNEHDQNPDVPEVLWHYTSSEGLKGIISESCFRFAEAIYMNDGSEVIYGIELLRSLLGNFAKENAQDHAFIIPQILDRIAATLDEFRSTIFCFCEETNLLNQWRDYGRDIVPYCIGIETKDLNAVGEYSFDASLSKVIYDRDLQERIMTDAIRRFHDKVVNIPGFGELADEEAYPYLMEAAIEFSQIILRFKNPAFQAEKEWRLIAYKPDIEKRVKRNFRSSTLGVIPFYEWRRRAQRSKLPIRSVVVGPSPYGRISHLALRELLEEYSYKDVETSFSTIPIRR